MGVCAYACGVDGGHFLCACIAIDSVRDRLFRLLRVNDRIDTLFAKIKPKNNAI